MNNSQFQPNAGEHDQADTQTEAIVTTLWTKMKALENKYIDLANYYKQELIQTKQGAGSTDGSSKSAVGGVVPPQHAHTKQPSFSGGVTDSEDSVISELKNVKIKFEQTIQNMLGNGAKSLIAASESSISIENADLFRFNKELEGAMSTMVDQINASQSRAINDLSQRQTDMFTLATKHKVSAAFNNDSNQVWYEAKANVTQIISRLKVIVNEKMQSIMAQSIKPASSWLESNKIQISKSQVDHQRFSEMVKNFEEEFKVMKATSMGYQSQIAHLNKALVEQEEAIMKTQNLMKTDLHAMYQTLMNYNPNSLAAQNSDSRQPSNRGNHEQISPFDKRLGSYSKGALSRSNSRGPISPLGNSSTFKPPKLTMQQSQGARGGKKASNMMVSPIRAERVTANDLGIVDNHAVITKLKAFENSMQRYSMEVQAKAEIVTELMERYQDQVSGNVQKFIDTHDIDIVKRFYLDSVLTPSEMAQIVAKSQAHKPSSAARPSSQTRQNSSKRNQTSSQSPFRVRDKSPSSQVRKTTPTRTKYKLNASNVSQTNNTPVKDVRSFNAANADQAQLYEELKKTNDKYIGQQVENRRLKDQVQLLSLQVEDLRLHNNRYQMQLSNFQLQMNKQRKTKTARPIGLPSVPSEPVSEEQLDVCRKIDQFFQSMKLLQRAVNKKEDISELKVDFETKQKALQKLSKALQARASTQQTMSTNKLSQSMISQNSRSNSTKGLGAKQNTSSRNTMIASPITKNRTRTSNKYGGVSPSKALGTTDSSRADNTGTLADAVKTQLEIELATAKQQIQQLKTESQKQAADSKMLQVLKARLVERIKLYESNLNEQVYKIKSRLERREKELEQVKTLFVEKLKELETNFAEIGDHLIANQISQAQQKAEIEKENLHSKNQSILQEVLKNAHKPDEDLSLDDLVKENCQLHDQINEFKKQIKDMVSSQIYKELKLKHEEASSQIQKLTGSQKEIQAQILTVTKERDTVLAEVQTQKQEKATMQATLKQYKEQLQQSQLDKEKQDMIISNTIDQIQQKLKDEIEQKLVFQKEAKDNSQLTKILEEENQHMQGQLEELSLEAQALAIKNEEFKKAIKGHEVEKDKTSVHIQDLKMRLNEAEQSEKHAHDELGKVTEECELTKAKLAETEEELRARLDLAEELEEKKYEVTKQLEGKEVMLNTLQEQLEQMQTRLEEQVQLAELNKEDPAKEEELLKLKEQLEQVHNAKINTESQLEELQQIKEQLEAENIHKEQQMTEMEAELARAKEEFKSKLEDEIEQTKEELSHAFDTKQAQIKKQNFWMTAITLKIKSMLQRKLAEEQAKNLENQEILREKIDKLNQFESEIESKDQEIAQSQELITTLKDQHNEELTRLIGAKQELEAELSRKHSDLENEKTTLASELEKLKLSLQDNQAASKEEKEAIRNKELEIEELRAQMEQLNAQRDEAHEEAEKHMQEQLSLLNSQIVDLKHQLDQKTKDHSTLQSLNANQSTKLETLTSKLESLQSELQDLHTLNTHQSEQLTTLQQESSYQITDFKQQINDLEAEKEEMDEEIQRLQGVIDEKEAEVQEKEAEVQAVKKEMEDVRREIEETEGMIQEIEMKCDGQAEKIEEKDAEIQVLVGQVKQLEASNDELTHSNESLLKQVAAFENEIKEHEDGKECSLKETADQIKLIEGLKAEAEHHKCLKDKVEEELKLANGQIQEMERELENAENESKGKIQELQNEIRHYQEEFEKTKTKLEDQLNEAQNDMEANQEKLEQSQKEIAQLKEQILKLETKSSEVQPQFNQLQSQINALIEDKEVLELNNESKTEELEQLNSQLASLTVENQNLETQVKNLEAQLDSKHDELCHSQTAQGQEVNQLKKQIQALEQQLHTLEAQKDQAEAELKKTKTESEQLNHQLKSEIDKAKSDMEAKNGELAQSLEEIEKQKALEAELRAKIESLHSEMNSKVEEGHDSIKKNFDIHKMNEELTQQLADKTELAKVNAAKASASEEAQGKIQNELNELKSEFENQKLAYDAVLAQLGAFETQTSDQQKEIEQLAFENQQLESKLKQSEKDRRNSSMTRNSVGSDEDYSSVQEMKDHLKHARHILVQFICKLQYSSPENESTLPVIYSMFEFTKAEQDQITETRKNFNHEKTNEKVKQEAKKMFGKLFQKGAKKDGDSARNSVSQGDNSSRHSNSKN